MREMLFRGKTDKGEWVRGVPFFEEDRCYIIEDLFICDEYDCTGAVNSMILPDTVGQYTGLTDKNGKKIFEGDIVECNGGFYQIVFEGGCFGAYQDEHYFFTLFSLYVAVEVVGNIHDNPELLKGGEG
jgi:uncharacterized phage protein (TIGR01671 family)